MCPIREAVVPEPVEGCRKVEGETRGPKGNFLCFLLLFYPLSLWERVRVRVRTTASHQPPEWLLSGFQDGIPGPRAVQQIEAAVQLGPLRRPHAEILPE